MPRFPLRQSLFGTVVAVGAAVCGNGMASGASWAQAAIPGPALAPLAQPSSALVEARTRAAAERLLNALRAGDGAAGYRLFAPSLQRMTSPAQVQQRIDRMPKLLSWSLERVVPGQDSSSVIARLRTAAGRRDLQMVMDAKGQLEGYHFDSADQPAELVARQFVEALAQGRYVSAASFLTEQLQSEIPPAALQVKWQNLQRITGDFIAVRQVFRSENTPDQKLVIVKSQFSRITDNLFVILDGQNRIVGVDFPTEPNQPTPNR
jgi:hypothetical protein